MYLPDPLEVMENRCERETEARCLPNGMYRCFCGKVIKLEHAVPASASPYATAICRECAGEGQEGACEESPHSCLEELQEALKKLS